MPNNSLNDYAVLITGGTTGLGLSHARVLGMRGEDQLGHSGGTADSMVPLDGSQGLPGQAGEVWVGPVARQAARVVVKLMEVVGHGAPCVENGGAVPHRSRGRQT